LNDTYQKYRFSSAAEAHMHAHFMPHVLAIAGQLRRGARILDVGCGNGFLCGEFLKRS